MGKFKDYSNQICGCWKVIERDYNPTSKSHETFWICECQNCGNKASVRKTDLDRKPQFCNNCKGTNLRSWKIGDKYGLLTIIGEGSNKGNHTYVKVQCDCGSDPFEVRLEHLKGQNHHGRTISCGCLSESFGEFKIKTILEQTNINFQREYRVVDENNKVMYFDFVILKNNKIIKAIEFDGEQHFKPIDYYGGEEAFIKQQERDARKAVYCRHHAIILQRIPYTALDKINLEMLLEGLDNSFLENEKIFGEDLDEQKPE